LIESKLLFGTIVPLLYICGTIIPDNKFNEQN